MCSYQIVTGVLIKVLNNEFSTCSTSSQCIPQHAPHFVPHALPNMFPIATHFVPYICFVRHRPLGTYIGGANVGTYMFLYLECIIFYILGSLQSFRFKKIMSQSKRPITNKKNYNIELWGIPQLTNLYKPHNFLKQEW